MNSPAGVPRPTEVSRRLSSVLSIAESFPEARSVDADIGLTAYGSPAPDFVLDVGLVMRGVEKIHVRTEGAEHPYGIGVAGDAAQRSLQHGDRFARRALRCEQAGRAGDDELRHAELCRGRKLGRARAALAAQHGDTAHLAAAGVRDV